MEMKRIALAIPILCLLVACGPDDLRKVGQGLDALAAATGAAQTSVISMNAAGQLDTDTTEKILDACLKINLAQKQAISITRAIAKLDKPTAAQLTAIMVPITAAVQDLVANGTVGIKNQDTKTKVQLLIVSVQSIVTAINISLGGT
jgi:hypothetical protein